MRVVADQLGGGYGRETAAGLRAMALARCQAGLSLEPVYTAKALAAIASDAARLRGKTVVFWNTHNAHPLPAGGDPEALPPALRRYFP